MSLLMDRSGKAGSLIGKAVGLWYPIECMFFFLPTRTRWGGMDSTMKKGLLQLILLLFLAGLCSGGFLLGWHVIQLPFNVTNAALNKDGYSFTLNFLIPGGTFVDDNATIGDVIRIKLRKSGRPFDAFLRTVSDQIPLRYRCLCNALLFFFWTLCFLSFLRVFTFMGYGRALRISLILGGITYYFMPDLSPGAGDDVVFLLFPILIILIRFYLVRRNRDKKKIFRNE
jgi:hypothetical protein